MRAPFAVRCSLFALLLLVAACETPPGKPGWTEHDSGDLIVIMLQEEVGHAVLFRVERTARIGFGGGMAAVNGNIQWQGVMSEADFAALSDVLDANDWFAKDPKSAGEPDTHFYRVTIYRPSGQLRRFSVHGPSPALDEVLEICDRSARQRFAPEMEQLPKPGVKRF